MSRFSTFATSGDSGEGLHSNTKKAQKRTKNKVSSDKLSCTCPIVKQCQIDIKTACFYFSAL